MATQALHFINANNGVHRHTASCVLSNSKRYECLKTTCPFGGKSPSEVGDFW